jgi:hypothetical protein
MDGCARRCQPRSRGRHEHGRDRGRLSGSGGVGEDHGVHRDDSARRGERGGPLQFLVRLVAWPPRPQPLVQPVGSMRHTRGSIPVASKSNAADGIFQPNGSSIAPITCMRPIRVSRAKSKCGAPGVIGANEEMSLSGRRQETERYLKSRLHERHAGSRSYFAPK